jgi:hypothetical protein
VPFADPGAGARRVPFADPGAGARRVRSHGPNQTARDRSRAVFVSRDEREA